MTKLSTFTFTVSLLALATPQLVHASGNDQKMPGLTGSTPAKAPVVQEDDLDAQIAAEEARQKQLQEQEEKRRKLEALKAANDKKQQELTVGQKVGRETDRVLNQAGKQAERLGKHLKKGKF